MINWRSSVTATLGIDIKLNSIDTKRKGEHDDAAFTTLISGQKVRRRSDDASGQDASIIGTVTILNIQ
jgi:hypothetical protein